MKPLVLVQESDINSTDVDKYLWFGLMLSFLLFVLSAILIIFKNSKQYKEII